MMPSLLTSIGHDIGPALDRKKDQIDCSFRSSFELEVSNQLSQVLQMVATLSVNMERIAVLDAKLDELLQRPHAAQYGLCGSSKSGSYLPSDNPSECHAVDTRVGHTHHSAASNSSDGQPSDIVLREMVAGEQEEEQESLQSEEEEDLSPVSGFTRRMSKSSNESWALSAIRSIVAVHKVDTCRFRMWTLLEEPGSSCMARIIYILMLCIIITSVLLTLVQTVDESPIDVEILSMVDTVFDGVFIVEVFLRFTFCPSRLAFFRNGYNIIDVVSATPMVLRCATGFMVPATQDQYTAVDFVLIVFVPTLRLLKLLRRFRHMRLLWFAMEMAMEALDVPLFLLFIICLTFSGILYVLEPRENIRSLPHALWVVVVTLSTVGYLQPTTPGGYVVTTILVAGGVLYMAVPISIVGNAWNSVWNRRDEILLMDLARERLKMWGYTAAEMGKLFDAFDLNHDQLLSIDEFSTMLSEMCIGLNSQRVAKLFDTLDTDQDGFVDRIEFAKALFPEQHMEAIRWKSYQKEDTQKQKPRSASGLFGLSRTLSGISNISNLIERSARSLFGSGQGNGEQSAEVEKTEEMSCKSSEVTRSRHHSRVDEYPPAQTSCVSPALPADEPPRTLPKSTPTSLIGDVSSGSRTFESVSNPN